MTIEARRPAPACALGKFENPDWTARGEQRANVALERLETLWFNTGTLCNITCVNCYIESSPKNDRLAYMSVEEITDFLDEIAGEEWGTREIGFTGGEPFMNPDILDMIELALGRGFEVLVLTNAMQPMQRPRVREGLSTLRARFDTRLTLRVSLDHYTEALHDEERGAKSWTVTLRGIDWLNANGFNFTIAGRTCWGETEVALRTGYARLISERGWLVDPNDPTALVLFPEMDEEADVPEITTSCWGILDKRPCEMMCASSRMVIRRAGSAEPAVVPCTLIAYDKAFEMGRSLKEAASADGGMFSEGTVKLCHPHCAKFCVLGGGSCSVRD